MATYRISGVWKDGHIITHYAVHTISSNGAGRAQKTTKARAIALVEGAGNIVTTYIWNYSTAKWNIGAKVHVVDDFDGKYLRSNHDKTDRDNLDHLIDYDWLSS